ncbi:MAG: nuclear transport factor 2 family protein [Candidatus Binatia bacterium]|nr:nuclear transport factor 2 family protein [Candidatus Binatia bacterium]
MTEPADLNTRVQYLEDIGALQRLLIEYSFAADIGDAEALSTMFISDAVYELDELRLEGRQQIVATVVGQRDDPAFVATAHTVGPVVIDVDGDRAVGRGYSRLYVAEGDGVTLWRLSFNRWEFVREQGRWRISRRVTRAVGHPEAAALLRNPS